MSQMQTIPCRVVDKDSNKLVQIPLLSKGIMALVVFGSGLPERFRIGSESNNYMYRSIYEKVVKLSLVVV